MRTMRRSKSPIAARWALALVIVILGTLALASPLLAPKAFAGSTGAQLPYNVLYGTFQGGYSLGYDASAKTVDVIGQTGKCDFPCKRTIE